MKFVYNMYFYCSRTWNSSENNHFNFFLSMPCTCKACWEIEDRLTWYNRTLDNCKECYHTWLLVLSILPVKPWYAVAALTIAPSRQFQWRTMKVLPVVIQRDLPLSQTYETSTVLTLEQGIVKTSFVVC